MTFKVSTMFHLFHVFKTIIYNEEIKLRGFVETFVALHYLK